MITRDIDQLIDAVVPGQNWDAVRLNASSTLKVRVEVCYVNVPHDSFR